MSDIVWPYDWTATESRLDPDQIQRDGSFMLSRALNTRSAIAFVGSGASAAYGRASWYDITLDHVTRLAAYFEKNEPNEDWYAELSTVAEKLKGERGSASSPILVVALQLCEMAWTSRPKHKLKALAIWFGFDRIYDIYSGDLPIDKLGRRLFQQSIKEATYDEVAYIRKLLPEDAVAKLTHSPGSAPKKAKPLPPSDRRLEATCERNNLYSRLFHKDTVLALLRRRRSRRPNEQASLKKLQEVLNTQPLANGFLEPSQYFIVGFLLSTAPYDLTSLLKARPSARLRSDFVSTDRDVLASLDVHLEIRRYATTNWDLEIERYFGDIGYSELQSASIAGAPESEAARHSPLGGRARAVTVGNERSVDLLDFAADESSSVYQVAHLHGRSTDDSDLVVTERDYQAAYVRHTKERTIVRESTEVLFGGNPILFVGLGMGEDDLLRPMRQFLSGDIRRNRSLVALVPPSKSRADCAIWAREQYSRYGVHIDFFGERDPGPDDDDDPPERWYYELRKHQKQLCDALRQGNPSLTAAMLAPFNSLLRELGGEEFNSDGVRCDLSVEVAVLSWILALLRNNASERRRNPAVAEQYAAAIERAVSSMASAALCAKIRSVGTKWRSWWKDWSLDPRMRGDAVAFGKMDHEEVRNNSWWAPSSTLWMRHVDSGQGEGASRSKVAQALRSNSGLGLFVNTVRKHNDTCSLPAFSRRVFVAVSPSGGGKGHLFNELKRLIKVRGEEDIPLLMGKKRAAPHRYGGAFFANFSFSSEVASVFDALLAFLISPESACEPRFAMRNEARRTGIDVRRVGRIGVLKAVLDRRKQQAETNAPPLLIVMNAVDLLLDADGYAKNAEIAEILHLLLSPEYARTAIDIVLLTRESRLPWLYRGDDAGVQVRRVRELEPRCTPLTILFDQGLVAGEVSATESPNRTRRVTAERARFDRFAERYSLRTNPHPDDESLTGNPPNSSGHFVHLIVPHDSYRGASAAQDAGTLGFDPTEYDGLAEVLDHECGLLSAGLRGSQYLYSIVVAALHGRLGYRRKVWRKAGLAPSTIGKQLQSEAEAFREDCLHDAAVSERGVSDRTIHFVLQQWFQLDAEAGSKVDSDLLHAVIKHLAVFGTPTEACVFLQCPEIQKLVAGRQPVARRSVESAFDARQGQVNDAALVAKIEQALALLHKRRLIFIIDRRYDVVGQAGVSDARYAVHRSVQKFIGRRISAQELGSAESNLFTVSLFASHSRHLPILSAGAYAFLQDLVESLVEYPGRGHRCIPKAGDRSKCLRTALGVLRSMFTIGVVVRFSELYGLRRPETSEQGYLERHRLVLRYMLMRAQLLDRGPASLAAIRKDLDAIQGLFGELERHSGDPEHPSGLSADDERVSDLRAVLTRRLQFVKDVDARPSNKMIATQVGDLRRARRTTQFGILDRTIEAGLIKDRIDSLKSTPIAREAIQLGVAKRRVSYTEPAFHNLAIREGLLQDTIAIRKAGYDAPPFYRDEIMWLFNECGVFSFAQGHLHDAHALFEKARSFGRSIEGVDGGHMNNRIALNQGFSELDRGNIAASRDLFQKVLANAPTSDVIIRLIADGGILCTRYMNADLAEIRGPLDRTMRALTDLGRARAAAIFSLVLAQTLHRLTVDAGREFERCLQLCTQAGAEDIMRLCRVQYARSCAGVGGTTLSRGSGEVPVNEWLNEAESYAHAMDMPRLLADVLIAKAELQCNLNELDAAADRATRALRVTTLYGMRLKKLEALEIMARINWQREPNEPAERLHLRALKSARDIGYLLLVQKAEALRKVAS